MNVTVQRVILGMFPTPFCLVSSFHCRDTLRGKVISVSMPEIGRPPMLAYRLTARTMPRSSVRKINSCPENTDEKPADEDAHDQPQGVECNPGLANAMISGIPDDDGRQE
jgi:hypothetical protein